MKVSKIALSIGCGLLAGASALLSQYRDDRKMEEAVDKAVEKRLSKSSEEEKEES